MAVYSILWYIEYDDTYKYIYMYRYDSHIVVAVLSNPAVSKCHVEICKPVPRESSFGACVRGPVRSYRLNMRLSRTLVYTHRQALRTFEAISLEWLFGT